MTSEIKHFNLRVYAIIFDVRGRVLLSDEHMLNTRMCKFPGGGLQFGEGIHDCLHREMMEEFGQDVDIIRHYYTTEFYQKALYFEDQQLISIYYICSFKETPKFRISSIPFDFEREENGSQSFRWALLSDMNIESELSFPIDKHVARMLLQDTE
jgi:8-oxo-dGTP diphosphatase